MTKQRSSNRSSSIHAVDVSALRHVVGGEEAKKPYQLTYKFAPEALKYESGTGATTKTTTTP
jgi:hypothetical protein